MRRRSDGAELYHRALQDDSRQIPLLLPSYRTYEAYQERYALGRNILLTDFWLRENAAHLIGHKEASLKKSTYNADWLEEQTFKYLQNNDWPVKDFLVLNHLDMLLILSQALQDASVKSMIPGLDFQKVNLIQLKDFAKLNYEEQVEFWRKIFLIRFGYDFNLHDNPPRLLSEFVS